MIKDKIRFVAASLILMAMACGCGGGGSDGGGDPPAVVPEPVTITGTAAAGAPIVGIVNVKGPAGNTASSLIELDGTFSLDVSQLLAPYILYAEGSVGGKFISIYSAAVAAGNINITPVTDFILRNALGGQAESAYAAWDTAQVDESSLIEAENNVQTQLAPLLTGAGVAADTDLISSPFTTDHTGLDAVLDGLEITYAGTTATITNRLTGSSYTDDIAVVDDGAGLPASDQEATQAVMADRPAMDLVWQSLVDLYAAAEPSAAELTEWFNTHVADDYLNDGENRTQTLDQWLYDEGGLAVGIHLSMAVDGPMDMTGTAYSKGYWVRFYTEGENESGNVSYGMVFDGTSWRWYGNRIWTESDEPKCEALMVVNSSGMTWYSTGLSIDIGDDFNYAYNQGVRSGVITGPGMPADGIVIEHLFPDPVLVVYPPNSFDTITDDAIISSIPDNAQYTLRLCPEPADQIYNGTATCTVLHEFTRTIMKPPVLNSELHASRFVSLSHPTSHAAADLNFGGPITIAWNSPENTRHDYVSLVWWNSGLQYELGGEPEVEGTTSVTLDATGLPAPDGMARFSVAVKDQFSRRFALTWVLQ